MRRQGWATLPAPPTGGRKAGAVGRVGMASMDQLRDRLKSLQGEHASLKQTTPRVDRGLGHAGAPRTESAKRLEDMRARMRQLHGDVTMLSQAANPPANS